MNEDETKALNAVIFARLSAPPGPLELKAIDAINDFTRQRIHAWHAQTEQRENYTKNLRNNGAIA